MVYSDSQWYTVLGDMNSGWPSYGWYVVGGGRTDGQTETDGQTGRRTGSWDWEDGCRREDDVLHA
eukprot:3628654-Prymnesium_polylepis.2